MREPPHANLFLVGQPRSGTTSLYRWLARQDGVFMCTPKEPNFFAPDLRSSSDVSTASAYSALFADADSHTWRGDASVCYLYSELAAEQIKAYNPSARIVVSLREPVDFIVSYFHKRRANPPSGGESARSVDEAIRLESQRRRGERLPPGVEAPSMLQYTDRARYVNQVQRFLSAFPHEQIFFTVFEDLTSAPTSELARLSKFLDVMPSDAELPNGNPSRSVRSRRALRLLNRLESGKGRMAPLKSTLKAVLPAKTRSRAMALARATLYGKKDAGVLSDSLRVHLRAEFRDEVQSLSALLNYDFVTRWGYATDSIDRRDPIA